MDYTYIIAYACMPSLFATYIHLLIFLISIYISSNTYSHYIPLIIIKNGIYWDGARALCTGNGNCAFYCTFFLRTARTTYLKHTLCLPYPRSPFRAPPRALARYTTTTPLHAKRQRLPHHICGGGGGEEGDPNRRTGFIWHGAAAAGLVWDSAAPACHCLVPACPPAVCFFSALSCHAPACRLPLPLPSPLSPSLSTLCFRLSLGEPLLTIYPVFSPLPSHFYTLPACSSFLGNRTGSGTSFTCACTCRFCLPVHAAAHTWALIGRVDDSVVVDSGIFSLQAVVAVCDGVEREEVERKAEDE